MKEENCIKADTLDELAAIEMEANNFVLAQSYLEQALAIYQEKKLLYGQARVFNSLGIIYYEKDDFVRAKEYFLKAKALYKQLGNVSKEAHILGNLSNAEMYLGNLLFMFIKILVPII